MHQRDDDIYASAPMCRLLDAQTRALAPELQRCFGTHALLLGASANDAPPALPMLGCWTCLHIDNGRYGGDLQASADEPLPFVDDAFELILLRHALEVAPHALALLAEAVRVLVPGGLLVLCGVHPISGWSPWFYWHARGKPQELQMPLQLRRNLQLAGLETKRVQRVGSLWPGLVMAGEAPARALGGGYVLIARKRRHMVTPLRFKSVPLRVPANGGLSPGTRRSSAM
jgi:SAM-dependent methyltransferase